MIDRSARSTSVSAVAVLLAGLSVSLSVAVAVLVIVPAGGVTTIVTVTVAPPFSVPRPQVIVVVPDQLPAVEFAETSVAPAGRVSVRVTPVAGSSPVFVTVIV